MDGHSMLIKILRSHLRWIVVSGLILVVFILGYAGFRQYYTEIGRERTVSDIIYVTVQLYVIQSGDLDGPINWKFQIARFAAPIVAAYAGFCALLEIFYFQVQLVRPWLMGGHVIVCGLGRKGAKLVRQLRDRGECVVVIEHDHANDQLLHCRQMGAVVLVGAANDRWVLAKACIHRAKALITIVGDDGINIETAVLAHDLNRKRASGSLECIVHVFDPRLQRVLKAHPIYADTSDPFNLRFFNAFELGAQAMLEHCPVPGDCPDFRGGYACMVGENRTAPSDSKALPSENPQKNASQPHLLIVGLGRLGEALLVQAATDWRSRRKDPAGKFHVTVVDRHALVKQNFMAQRYPDLSESCHVAYVEMDIHFPDFPGRVPMSGDGAPPVTAAFVCVDADSLALFAALALHDSLKEKDVPIIVRLTEQAGLGTLLGCGPGSEGLIPGIHAVGLLDVVCSLDLIYCKSFPGR
jgi:hypothetical protein